ncbi:CYTH and CHAD domain-containing protein [Corynebacterium breve]|uniref:CYTH and CHAD domain-containing protein n=1 Tax=Corynebacterium breve TaxID=3049799 RepID=A0ABY8VE53_9CORY|nr:CYTH and CHAD domain-containing protein [Corynebacterium breve]WIM67030.1 CYTH and CHAD domain-containing protein [Corynebacterium breve]
MTTPRFLEVEAKFAIDETTAAPELTTLPAVEKIGETVEHHLSAIYYDTADLRLTRSKITLRRRTGGKDDGWHIKLPSDLGRIELAAPLTEPSQIPDEIMSNIRAIVRTAPLEPIAQVDNRRVESILLNADDAPVAEFCDDHVTAWSLLPGGERTSWREWEVELAGEMPGTEEGTELIRQATTYLIAQGARVSSSPSKLVSALGRSQENAPLPPHLAGILLPEGDPAFAVVEALRANRDSLISWDPRVRRDEWDSVHQMRVATRELRSHLETFEGILVSDELDYIEDELKELARILGEARDAEVVEERFHDLLDSDATGLIDDTAAAHIKDDMRAEYNEAHARIVDTLNSDRYLALLDTIDQLIAHPPVVDPTAEVAEGEESGGKPAKPSEVLYDHLAEAYKKLMKRHQRVVDNYGDLELPLHQREDYVHDMRKTAKKLRYAAEAVGEASKKLKTGKLARSCKSLQSLLGDFQDAVTARDRLADLAQDARERGEDTFAYGMLYQREMDNAAAALEGYDDVVADIKRGFKKL